MMDDCWKSFFFRVPIWKKEIYEGDASVWKENVEWHEGRSRRVMCKDEHQQSSKVMNDIK